MSAKTKRILLIIILLGIIVSGFLIVRAIVFNRIKKAIHEEITRLNTGDLSFQYDLIHIDWRKNFIRIDSIKIEKDSVKVPCKKTERISAVSLEITGVSLFTLLFAGEMKVDKVVIHKPDIVLAKKTELLKPSGKHDNNFSLAIDELYLNAGNVEITDSASCNVVYSLNSTVRVKGLEIETSNGQGQPDFKSELVEFDSTTIHLPEEFYSITLKRMRVNFFSGNAHLDTLRILPHHTKLAFGRKKKHETDRIEGAVPYIKLNGFSIITNDTFAIRLKKADIQMFLKLFRDKRLPHKRKFTLLPVQQLRTLPFGLNIDTLQITKSYVSYEEIPEEAETSGTVFFDNLSAKILQINNDPQLISGHTIIQARADFMGDGDLEMHTVMPWKKGAKCSMKGSLRNFSFVKINSMLMPAANLQVRSGSLTYLRFNYTYDLVRSNGEIELNYKDLRLETFKEPGKNGNQKTGKKSGKGDEPKKDGLKSLILNAFVIRKNMTSSVPEEKRTGTVMFQRDTQRSIFNYWWKSVFSGVKSAYNIDPADQN